MIRYHRTINEAFPKTMEYGASIEIYPQKITLLQKVYRVVFLVAIIVVACDLFIWRP